MGSAELGMVGDEDVAALEFAFPDFGLGADAGRHAAEMDGEMRSWKR